MNGMIEGSKDHVELREALLHALALQTEHAVYRRYEVDWSRPVSPAAMFVRYQAELTLPAGEWFEQSLPWLTAELQFRRQHLANEQDDPYVYGWEPEMWRETDWRTAELRCAFPGEPVTVAILGGNGSTKTHFGAKRFAIAMCENEDWLGWSFAEEEKASREVPQRWIYHYLPAGEKTDSGKRRKTARTKMSYNITNGFTDNTFSLENKCRANFSFYNANIKGKEGPRPHIVWADEMEPVNFMEISLDRLLTNAGHTRALVPALKAALAGRATGDPLAWHKHLRPLLPKLYEGIHLITFTPKYGYTDTVAKLTAEARTVVEVDAELLPIVKQGVLLGYEKVPLVQVNEAEKAVILYFHPYINPIGGNWDGMKSRLKSKSRETVLWMAYGIATRTVGVQFPIFTRQAHVRSMKYLPAVGTWYMTVDPCTGGRPWVMGWHKVSPNPGGKDVIFKAREWPQPGDWIDAQELGDLGEWAVPSSGKRFDGDAGTAQRIVSIGFQDYAHEIERVELELGRLEVGMFGDKADVMMTEKGPRIRVHQRIMDSKTANTATQTHGESVTLLEIMEEYDLYFDSAGRDSGAEHGSTFIRQGRDMIVDRMTYEQDRTDLLPDEGIYKFHGRAPSYFVCDQCRNTIFCLMNWTGKDGGEGATKDFVDVERYLVIAGPRYVDARGVVTYVT